MEQNPQSHQFQPNKKGKCKFIAGRYGACHLAEDAPPHENWNRRVREVEEVEELLNAYAETSR